MLAEHVKVTELRKYRLRVRHLLNLVSHGQRITERPGTWWAADMETNEVEWIYSWPFEPYSKVDDDGLRYCVSHEASHVKWSGLYETKLIPPDHAMAFHRFVNAVEDCRVDRLSIAEFGGFRESQLRVRRMIRRTEDATSPEGWGLVDAVAMNTIHAFEIGEPPRGDELAIKASKRLWPKLDRIANLRSTQEVATALEPIYLALFKAEQLQEQQKEQEAEQQRREEERQRQQEQAERDAQREQDERDRKEGRKEESGEVGPPQPGEQSEPGQGGDPGESEKKSKSQESQDPQNQQDPQSGSGGESGREPGATKEGAGGQGEPAQGEPQAGQGSSSSTSSEVGKQEGQAASGAGGAEPNRTEAGEPAPAEPAPAPIDPMKPVDDAAKKRSAGADKPTETPIKSDGKDGTEPLPLGRELEGAEEQARDFGSQRALREARGGAQRQKQQNEKMRDTMVGKRHPPTPLGTNSWKQRQDELRQRINSLSNRIKAVLRQNSMEHASTGHRRGKLDIGKVHRLKAGNVRVFRQPGTIGGLDYTFGILVDTSGSMYASRPERLVRGRREIDWAYDACVLVAEALERAGLGFFVVLWDVEMPHVKPLHEPLVAHRSPLGSVLGRDKGGGKTIESPALAKALDEMEKVKGGRKMLITITDGGTSTIEESKELLEELAGMHVQALTIRIGEEPAAHYRHGYKVEHADELVQLLPRLINSVIRRQ